MYDDNDNKKNNEKRWKQAGKTLAWFVAVAVPNWWPIVEPFL